MRQLRLLLLPLLTSTTVVQAQHTEFSLHATSGYYRYRGESATGTTQLFGGQSQISPAHTDNPYGNRFTLSYGGGVQTQRITAHTLVLGAQAGYEWLRSRANVNYLITTRIAEPVRSHVTLTNRFINTHVFGGKRFTAGICSIDATVGPEVGLLLQSREQSTASAAGVTLQADNKVFKYIKADIRVRLNVTAYYQRFGLTGGYSYGLTNYLPDYDGILVDRKLYSQMLRAGLIYRMH
ncbi:hypothetical protein [Hymenobacter sp. 102]|uniref:hypothetical protein n=1 Tax=Hymenobacter sp. 102 TaxID=3403152 RepID=UPI003CE961BC